MLWKTITFNQFHEPTRMSTCPNPCLESSLTPSHMPKPNASKIISFQNKSYLFLKTHYRVSVKYWTTLRGESVGYLPKQFMGPSDVNCWTISQHDSPENLSSKFLSQTFSFLFHFMSCTHTNILDCPSAYGMHYANSK